MNARKFCSVFGRTPAIVSRDIRWVRSGPRVPAARVPRTVWHAAQPTRVEKIPGTTSEFTLVEIPDDADALELLLQVDEDMGVRTAVLARASGARRVLGFSIWHVREKGARPFYSDVDGPDHAPHVIQKNLSLLSTVGVNSTEVRFPLARTASAALEMVKEEVNAGGGASFALLAVATLVLLSPSWVLVQRGCELASILAPFAFVAPSPANGNPGPTVPASV